MQTAKQKQMKHNIPTAPIDQPISRELLASPNLVGDRAAHPLCDHQHS